MHRTPRGALFAIALLACGGQAPHPDASAEAPAPEAPLPAPAAPPPPLRTPGALRPSTWMFYDPIGPLGCGLGGGGLSADCDPHFIGDPRVYHARAGHLVREDAGQTVFDVPLGEPAGASGLVVDLRIERDELRIGAVVDGDVVVMRRSADTGAILADYRIAHPGSPATAVQLDGGGDAIVVRALAERPWSAMIDASDGTLIDRAEVGVALAELSPDAPERAWQGTRSSASAGGVTARRRHLRSTEPAWDVALDDPFDCGAYGIADLGAELAVVHHCPGSSGATLTFFDRRDGAAIASVVGGTIGSIGHSRYQSAVALAVHRDLVLVRGEESGGDYVCVVEPREHRTMACLVQRR